MSIWTAPFQEAIDEVALAQAQMALDDATDDAEKLRSFLHYALQHTGAEQALLLRQSQGCWRLVAAAGQPHQASAPPQEGTNPTQEGANPPQEGANPPQKAGGSSSKAGDVPHEAVDKSSTPRALWLRRSARDQPLRDEAPLALIEYSAKIQDAVVLEDASNRGGWTHNPCVQRQSLRAVLCIPFAYGDLAPPPPKESLSMRAEAPRAIDGALYLADRRQPHLFRPGRVALVEQLLLQYLAI